MPNITFPKIIRTFLENIWNKFYLVIRCAHLLFPKKSLEFVRPVENSAYRIHGALGIKLLNRLIVGFSHLRERKFRHNFLDNMNVLP